MRRRFFFDMPTLLLSCGIQIQILGALLLWLFSLPIEGNAQVAPPPTSISPTPAGAGGLRTIITPSALPESLCSANCAITGGTRPGGGGNLFHSFGQFNIGPGDIATFQNGISFDGSGNALAAGLPTSNILARVTGINGSNPSLSSIYGTLQTSGFGNVNLFMMNPAGFLFGSGATVNVGGMVAFTSADYLRLQDIGGGNAGIFHADTARGSILTTAPVASYGFLGSNPGAITVQGSQLSVSPGQSISLVGGNIAIQSGTQDNGAVQSAKLSAPDGQINLASVASPGEILAGTLSQALNVDGQSFGNLGSIQITEQSIVDVSGNGGGTVLIRGGQFLLDNSTISANVTGSGPVVNGTETIGGGIDIQVAQSAVIQSGTRLETNVKGSATPGVTYGGIHIKADRIEIIGDPGFDFVNGPFTEIHSDVANVSTAGNSGPIKLEANSILLQDFVNLQTQTDGAGSAGDIILRATGNLEINGPFVQSYSFSPGSGNAGNIELSSNQGSILMPNAALITTQVLAGTGNTGNITVTAPNGDVLLAGVPGELFIPGSLFTKVSGTAQTGVGGEIRITANNLTLANAAIAGDNFSPQIPGNITITLSGSLNLDGQNLNFGQNLNTTFIETVARGSASSADLSITAHDINVTNGAYLSTRTVSSGNGGSLNISTDNLQLTSGGQIRSGSVRFTPFTPIPTGAGGTVNIQGLAGPAESVRIDGADSGIFTNTEGTGAGGNTNVTAQSLTIQNGGTISAATSGTAPSATGGTISVNANTVNLASGGTMTAASSGPGASGEVVVQGLASPAHSLVIDGSASGIFTNTSETGAGGDIHLFANSVTLQNSGELSAATSGTASSATGGTITVTANQVALNNQAHINADTNGIAPAGVVDINTASLSINSGGQIRSSSGAETEQISALAFSLAAPTLAGGTIAIQGQSGNGSQVDSVTIDGSGSGIFTQSTGSRSGGDINILTSQSVALSNNASVSASSTGTGNAGNIQIGAGNQFAMTNSKVTTEATQASGGSIKITTTPIGTVELTNSTISASVLDGTGGGGSVDIDPQFVILQNSQILANAVFGPGGNINITTNLLLQDTASVISASSQFGQQGTIFIQSPISPASGKILPLGQKPLIVTSLLSQRCAALAGGNASSFTVAGRDSLPAEPGGWVPTPLALASLSADTGQEEREGEVLSGLAEPPILSLRKIAPPGFLVQSFAVDSSDCSS